MEHGSSLVDFAASLVESSRTLVDDLEVWTARERTHSVRIENQSLSPRLAGQKLRVGIRTLKEGMIGYGALMELDLKTALRAVKRALGRGCPANLDRFGSCRLLSDPVSADRALVEMADKPSALYEMAGALRDRTYEVAGTSIDSLSGEVRLEVREIAVTTQGGSTRFSNAAVQGVAAVDNVMEEYYWTTGGSVDRRAVAELGAEAFRALQRPRVAPEELKLRGSVPVILHPRLLESLLRILGSEKFSGSAHLAGLSHHKPADEVADPAVTLWDDATEPTGTLRRPVDDEGTPCRRHPLIEGGRFGRHIWSQSSARRAGVEPTGHGYRRPILIEEPQEAPVREKLSALAMEPGEMRLDQLIGETGNGLLVYDLLALHTADQARASFSCAVLCGFSIEGGKISRVLTPGRWNLSGHLFDLDGRPGFLREVRLSSERIHTGSAHLPYLKTRLAV